MLSPNETNRQKAFQRIVHFVVGVGVVVGGVAALSKHGKLPLGGLPITLTVIATIVLRGLGTAPKKEADEVGQKAESPKAKTEVKAEAKV